jgi:hypothetical protein
MKLFTPVGLLAASLMTFGAAGANLTDVKSVYLLPMLGGLDQFLAIRLTTGGILQVVTDPKQADAIFTDRIGANLNETLADLYDEKPKHTDKDDPTTDVPKVTPQPIVRGRGNIFLIDRKTRAVLWGDFEKPRGVTPDDVRRVANQIAGKIEKSLKAK